MDRPAKPRCRESQTRAGQRASGKEDARKTGRVKFTPPSDRPRPRESPGLGVEEEEAEVEGSAGAATPGGGRKAEGRSSARRRGSGAPGNERSGSVQTGRTATGSGGRGSCREQAGGRADGQGLFLEGRARRATAASAARRPERARRGGGTDQTAPTTRRAGRPTARRGGRAGRAASVHGTRRAWPGCYQEGKGKRGGCWMGSAGVCCLLLAGRPAVFSPARPPDLPPADADQSPFAMLPSALLASLRRPAPAVVWHAHRSFHASVFLRALVVPPQQFDQVRATSRMRMDERARLLAEVRRPSVAGHRPELGLPVFGHRSQAVLVLTSAPPSSDRTADRGPERRRRRPQARPAAQGTRAAARELDRVRGASVGACACPPSKGSAGARALGY